MLPPCPHGAALPAAFELQTGRRSLRYADHAGDFAAASTFGGRWRVTGADGRGFFSLAPSGPAGSDDRVVLPQDATPVATLLRDRRRLDSWLVLDPDGEIAFRAVATDAYEVLLTDPDGLPAGRVWATATAVTLDFGTAPAPGLHCTALALPLFFATTGALRIEPRDPTRSWLFAGSPGNVSRPSSLPRAE
jgi:hypothetical protein